MQLSRPAFGGSGALGGPFWRGGLLGLALLAPDFLGLAGVWALLGFGFLPLLASSPARLYACEACWLVLSLFGGFFNLKSLDSPEFSGYFRWFWTPKWFWSNVGSHVGCQNQSKKLAKKFRLSGGHGCEQLANKVPCQSSGEGRGELIYLVCLAAQKRTIGL